VLHYVRRLLRFRKANPVLVYGEYQLLDRENPEVYAYTRSLDGRTLMVALSFSAAGGRTALPPGYTSGRLLISNLASSPLRGTQLALEPYQAVVLELTRD
jgi:oligo-1,6-glucosidase